MKQRQFRRMRALKSKSRLSFADEYHTYRPGKFSFYATTQSPESIRGVLSSPRSRRKVSLPPMPWDKEPS